MSKMMRRILIALSAAAAMATLVSTAAFAQNLVGKNKVIFQVSDGDPQKWNLALNNVKNLQDELRTEGAELEIVAYGPGIGMLKDDSIVATRIADALKGGVKVVACENTMKAQKLLRGDMLPAIAYVPAGVVELMRKQQDGYAYIRP